MRPASEQAILDLAAHGEEKRALVLFYLANANGRRVFCRTAPPDALIGQSGRVFLLDGSWILDGSVKLGEGSEELLGVHDWVIDGGAFSQGKTSGASPLEVFRQKELSGLTLTLSNEPDDAGHPRMSRLLAQEPFVGARLDVRVGFSGQTTGDVIGLASFTVRRIIERRGAAALECEGA
ncbi:MAG: hypothetical protein O2807_10385 [bacterium]|nr:hypothetical protein [bacterium]